MRNPIFLNKHVVKFYLFVWVMIMSAHASLSFFTEGVTLYQAVTDAILSDVLFAGMMIGVWYPIRYLNLETRSAWTFFIHHVGMATTFLFIWLSGISCALEMFIPDPGYQVLFKQSLPWRVTVTFLFYCLSVLGYYLYIYYSSFKQKQVAEAELKSLVKETELNLLKSQLNPHFIFNSLNSISSLTISDPECAQEMIVKLSAYIRYALNQKGNELVTFAEELENSRLYLAIEKVRFGSKLVLEDNCKEETMNMKVPNMLLQPLLENAIKHGVYESLEPVSVILEGNVLDNDLLIKITNTYEPAERIKQGNGIGLKNIRDRLSLLYGNIRLMKIEDSNNSFQVEIVIPQPM